MHLSHPAADFQGIPKEDAFFAANDRFVQMGFGYVILSMQPELYPDKPMHIYLYIEAQPSARNLLLGALLARAEQIRALYPHLKGRIYTHLQPNQWEMLNFYSHNGFINNDAEEEYVFSIADVAAPTPPMGCQFASVPLSTQEEAQAFLNRINMYRMTPITPDYLTVQMQQPYFMALGFYRGGQPIGEIMVSGAQLEMAGLVTMYVVSSYRRRGIGKALAQSAAALLRERGVRQCATQIYSLNEPQVRLVKSLGASRRRIVGILPSIDIG